MGDGFRFPLLHRQLIHFLMSSERSAAQMSSLFHTSIWVWVVKLLFSAFIAGPSEWAGSRGSIALPSKFDRSVNLTYINQEYRLYLTHTTFPFWFSYLPTALLVPPFQFLWVREFQGDWVTGILKISVSIVGRVACLVMTVEGFECLDINNKMRKQRTSSFSLWHRFTYVRQKLLNRSNL